jgi:hypothetical protein
MADAFSSALKEFESVVAEIGEMRERLAALEASRDRLRKQLRSLAGNTESSSALGASGESSAAPSLAITEIVTVVRTLGGSAKLADIAKAAALDTKVTATRLQRAEKLGFIKRVGHGQYQLPTDQLQALLSGAGAVSNAIDSTSVE